MRRTSILLHIRWQLMRTLCTHVHTYCHLPTLHAAPDQILKTVGGYALVLQKFS